MQFFLFCLLRIGCLTQSLLQSPLMSYSFEARTSQFASLALNWVLVQAILFSKEKLKVLWLSIRRCKDGWVRLLCPSGWMTPFSLIWSTATILRTTRAFLSLFTRSPLSLFKAFSGSHDSHGHSSLNLVLLLLLETDLLVRSSGLSILLFALLRVGQIRGRSTTIDKLLRIGVPVFVRMVHLLSSCSGKLPWWRYLRRTCAILAVSFVTSLSSCWLVAGSRILLAIHMILVWVGMLIMALTILLRHFSHLKLKL